MAAILSGWKSDSLRQPQAASDSPDAENLEGIC